MFGRSRCRFLFRPFGLGWKADVWVARFVFWVVGGAVKVAASEESGDVCAEGTELCCVFLLWLLRVGVDGVEGGLGVC